jgi:dihydrodipicolinate synthase/N-acetylneuraminate lyase
MKMLAALRACDYEEVNRIRGIFKPLEDLRNEINPVRVLHAAVQAAEIALTGPLLPFMSDVNDAQREQIGAVAKALLGQR